SGTAATAHRGPLHAERRAKQTGAFRRSAGSWHQRGRTPSHLRFPEEMMAVASPTDNESLTLEDFFDHVRYSNPFDQDRVSDPAEADVDVESIHHAQFE